MEEGRLGIGVSHGDVTALAARGSIDYGKPLRPEEEDIGWSLPRIYGEETITRCFVRVALGHLICTGTRLTGDWWRIEPDCAVHSSHLN